MCLQHSTGDQECNPETFVMLGKSQQLLTMAIALTSWEMGNHSLCDVCGDLVVFFFFCTVSYKGSQKP